MIKNLYKNIAAGLKVIKSCKVYAEDVPQNFVLPSFLISFYDQNPTGGINGRLKNTVSVDISYFPKSKLDSKEECWNVGQSLSREFAVEAFKIKNRNLSIVDNVLHFMFDVDYREYKPDESSKMQDVTQNTDVKEE